MDRNSCNGEFRLGNWTFKDWKEGGHGHVDTRTALIHSCNIFFYQAGLKVGPAAIARYSEAFRLGSPSSIDLGGEKAALVPFLDRRPRIDARKWHAGDTVNMCTCQGRPLRMTRSEARHGTPLA